MSPRLLTWSQRVIATQLPGECASHILHFPFIVGTLRSRCGLLAFSREEAGLLVRHWPDRRNMQSKLEVCDGSIE